MVPPTIDPIEYLEWIMVSTILITLCLDYFSGTSIGKRYARTDEIGVPLAITVDSTMSVTIRDRDSKEQIRVDIEEVASVVKEVTDGQSTWADVMWRYPTHAVSHADAEPADEE